METIDDETCAAALDFIDRQHRASKPWFCYFNSTRMHVNTHLKPEVDGKTGKGIYPDGMVEHDGHVGQLLKKLDDLGVTQNTIVVYTTDNGAEVMTWPDGGNTPFRGEKATNWEGGFRVPMLIRWPGVIRPGTIYNEVFSHYDLIPTFCAAGGEPDVVAKCLRGHQANGKTFKVHLDGYNLMPFLSGSAKEGPRRDFLYWNDDGELVAIRVDGLEGGLQGAGAYGHRRLEARVHQSARTDCSSISGRIRSSAATSRSSTRNGSSTAPSWSSRRRPIVAQWLESFKEFPIRQKPASFNLDDVMAKLAPKN